FLRETPADFPGEPTIGASSDAGPRGRNDEESPQARQYEIYPRSIIIQGVVVNMPPKTPQHQVKSILSRKDLQRYYQDKNMPQKSDGAGSWRMRGYSMPIVG
ncbi:MAG: hypothetical protein LBS67_01955, partial [Clostridiales Family XIII bacterium]|nr:hypothetical protein [Clostridiales Family XIII bacterium]